MGLSRISCCLHGHDRVLCLWGFTGFQLYLISVSSYTFGEVHSPFSFFTFLKNVKAYLRRGTAREMLGYYKEAIEDFRYALLLEPTNKRASVSAERLKNLF
ncbi:hypothetical protein Ancab_036134 [Ancistrocladus abbreviatus]